jgi:ABC-type transport system involved in multi-copper enzyme maturation permease subunit
MRDNTMNRYRYTPNELHARMVVTVGVLLAIVFSLIVLGMIWGLLFVSQPLEQSPNDAAFIDLMSTIVVFLTGTLSGLVASNGIKNKTSSTDD